MRLPANPRNPAKKSLSEGPRPAFALIIAIALMAFIFMLLVSISTLLRTEVRSASTNNAMAEARQNALLGLEVALGQLQQHAGADQRITLPATVVYPVKNRNGDSLSDDWAVGQGPLYDDPVFGYRTHAQVSTQRSYLNHVGTYLTHAEREAWDQALTTWWNDGRNPRWTGVMDSALRVNQADKPNAPPEDLPAQRYESQSQPQFGEPDRTQLPIWLISGNEHHNFDPETTTSYPDGYLTPDTQLPDPKDDPDIIWIVGAGSSLGPDHEDEDNDGDTHDFITSDGLDGRVKALRQPILLEDRGTTGHYAYWVSDESQKANFTVREPEALANSTPSDREYNNRLQVPQRIGWERMTGFDIAHDLNPNDPAFERIVGHLQAELIDPRFADYYQNQRGPLPRNFHNITSYSKSLFTDPMLGGLQRDLTRYLETGDGLNDLDPIADRQLYQNDDPRFGAWDSSNEGFPGYSRGDQNGDGIREDGLPTWGQLRNWYVNDATDTSGLTPDSNTAPVLTYLMLHAGLSYHPTTKRIRWHWLPCVVLWNPYDTELNNATYDLEIGVSPQLGEFYVCNDSPSLTTLQLDVDAEWDNRVIGGTSQRSFRRRDSSGTPVYEAELTTDPDTTNISSDARRVYVNTADTNGNGVDDGLEDGVSDAFGRFYYRLEPVRPNSEMWVDYLSSDTNGEGPLGDIQSRIHFMLHDGDADEALPVNHPLQFSISTSFEAGEVKVFTMGSNRQWSSGSSLPLDNDFDPDQPPSVWFDIFEVVNGPSSATSENLKWFFQLNASSIVKPTVHFKINGATILRSDLGLGENSYGMVTGNIPSSGWEGNDQNDDSDSDGVKNNKEPMPKFVSNWRRLYDFNDFENNASTTNTANSSASIFSYGSAWLQPLTGDGDARGDSLHSFLPAFSRFNLGAKSFEGHPIVDFRRHDSTLQNYDADGHNEGLAKLLIMQSGVTAAWDEDQAAGSSGFALVNYQQNATPTSARPFLGLDTLVLRNARRQDSEILSLGQLQQANLSPYFWQPSFPIGNGEAPLYTDREAIAGLNSRILGTQTKPASNPTGHGADLRRNNSVDYRPPSRYPNNPYAETDYLEFGGNFHATVVEPGNAFLDISYLLNENLWDRYFLSTIKNSPSDLSEPLPNSRIRFAETASTAGSELTSFTEAAAHLRNVGALNVNSTSVEAWKALLTAFRGLVLEGDGQRNPNPDDGGDPTVPVSRTLAPVGGPIEFTSDTQNANDIGATANNKDYETALSGFRYLTDDMIQTLAERIVDEIRLRGPFLSMADFVNRRLVAPQGSNIEGSAWYEARTNGRAGIETQGTNRGGTDTEPDFIAPDYDPFIGLQGLNGTLQRAINLSGINGGVNHPDLGINGDGAGEIDDRVMTIRIKNAGTDDFQSTNYHFDNNGIGGTANSEDHHTQEPSMRCYLDSEHLAGAPAGEAGQLFAGTSAFVTQGDLLAMIGPALTARGDTFLIRTYGDTIDPLTGEIVARAWLEAVVQRETAPVQPDPNDPWRYTDSLGRKFTIVSIRWLAPDDV